MKKKFESILYKESSQFLQKIELILQKNDSILYKGYSQFYQKLSEFYKNVN